MFEIGTNLLEFCILLEINRADKYGYELTKRLVDNFGVSESTVYPVLRRLQKQNYLATYDKEANGRNRRYYTLTDTGKEILKVYFEDWENYKNKIDSFAREGL